MYKEENSDTFKVLIGKLNSEIFQIPKIQNESDYFPEYLGQKLAEYVEMYCNELKPILIQLKFSNERIDKIEDVINMFRAGLNQTVDYYYSGKIYEAIDCFYNSLNNSDFHSTNPFLIIKERTSFFRARIHEVGKEFSQHDLFHIKFESRHIVSTQRYSIPGFPALYLGDTCYVCWEEFNRHRFRDLWFSRFSNTKPLKIIQIQRAEDLITEIEKQWNSPSNLVGSESNSDPIYRYLLTFPLILACTIKVNKPKGNFKSEYIIPQLLLQYVSKNEEIDGIKFPSTKIDYSDLKKGIEGYNYVFPVKESSRSGYCKKLTETFLCTEPTSLELEEIMQTESFTMRRESMVMYPGADKKIIEIMPGVESQYYFTAFGKIEQSLGRRHVRKIESSTS